MSCDYHPLPSQGSLIAPGQGSAERIYCPGVYEHAPRSVSPTLSTAYNGVAVLSPSRRCHLAKRYCIPETSVKRHATTDLCGSQMLEQTVIVSITIILIIILLLLFYIVI